MIFFVSFCFAESSLFFIFQGFYQLLEPKVTIRCRQQDIELVQVRLDELRCCMMWLQAILESTNTYLWWGKVLCFLSVLLNRLQLIRTFQSTKRQWKATLLSKLTRNVFSQQKCKMFFVSFFFFIIVIMSEKVKEKPCRAEFGSPVFNLCSLF